MSPESIEVVRRQYDYLNRVGEPDRASFTRDAVFDASRILGPIQQGVDEFLAEWLPYRDTFDGWWIEVEELLDGQHERVFAAVRDGGRLKESGAEIRQALFHVWEVRDGKIVAWTGFSDRAEALEAAGLQE